ncbi:hypothetical protein G7068_00030 [Leucobacter viscericola]|uniref:Uncharacterized protein n=1 Tax=Leucobacter viscericola TaxID=2714935 RepID=A0A6G7XB42_9MICO|nr:hypothetical protein [Leucobacter viscericola]QIK61773.1 hypothetical protein G7068_00030 [Leucobacter viscericola]
MMSTLMLRGLEFELEKLDIDIVVTPKFISVTVSAIEAGDEGAHNRLFAHTHLTDLDLESHQRALAMRYRMQSPHSRKRCLSRAVGLWKRKGSSDGKVHSK